MRDIYYITRSWKRICLLLVLFISMSSTSYSAREVGQLINTPNGKIIFVTSDEFPHLRVVGSGSFSVVVAAKSDRGEQRAIKRVQIDQSDIDRKKTLRELILLEKSHHPNILSLQKFTIHLADQGYAIHLWTDFFEQDLYTLYKKKPLNSQEIRSIIYQIVSGLNYLHSMSVAHRDLKPQNIFIDNNLRLKIGDLGLARFMPESDEESRKELSNYVVTRWYRAPEVLDKKKYGCKIDIWALGCIFAELKLNRPFITGASSEKQRKLIAIFSQNPLKYLPPSSAHGQRVLQEMLNVDPEARSCAKSLLKDPYFDEFYSPEAEEISHQDLSTVFAFERGTLSEEQFLAEISAIKGLTTFNRS